MEVKVCVVGAGISGLGAAADLVAAGVTNIVVLEALNRPGGRIHSLSHGSSYLELGAHWIHGEEGNCVYEWAKKHCPESVDCQLSLTQTGIGRTLFIDPNGDVIEQSVVEGFQTVAAELDKNADTDFNSRGESYERRFGALNEWGSVGWQLLEWHGRFTSLIDGAGSWHSVSCRTLSEYWDCPGNPVINWNNNKGFQTLVDYLVKKVGTERIVCNNPVLNIKWNDEKCEQCRKRIKETSDLSEYLNNLSLSRGTNNPSGISDESMEMSADELSKCRQCGMRLQRKPCSVTLSDRIIYADHVIFSGSLGVLKSSAALLFDPPLSLSRNNSIQGLGFDVVAKIYLSFPDNWWCQDIEGYSFVSDITEKPPDPTESWEEYVLGVYTVWKQPNMLCAWLGGAAALAMERTPLADVINRCYLLLCRRLKRLTTVPKPTWGTRSLWGTCPFTQGAYSFRSTASDEKNVWAQDLAEPLCAFDGTPVVLFCGEATHPHYYSTVHGAWETGAREARRLLKHWSPNTEFRSLCTTTGWEPLNCTGKTAAAEALATSSHL